MPGGVARLPEFFGNAVPARLIVDACGEVDGRVVGEALLHLFGHPLSPAAARECVNSAQKCLTLFFGGSFEGQAQIHFLHIARSLEVGLGDGLEALS